MSRPVLLPLVAALILASPGLAPYQAVAAMVGTRGGNLTITGQNGPAGGVRLVPARIGSGLLNGPPAIDFSRSYIAGRQNGSPLPALTPYVGTVSDPKIVVAVPQVTPQVAAIVPVTTLGRIEEGVYGDCATCGEPVGEKRLAVIPHAAQCIACASK